MSIGSELKKTREARKIALETVSARTKIPIKYLEALEEDRYEVFPSHTYAKGFIRAYAKVVGMDPMILTRQFNADIKPMEVRIEPKNAEVELEKTLGWRPTLDRPPVFRRADEDAGLDLEMIDEGTGEDLQHDPSIMRQRAFASRRGKWGRMTGKTLSTFLAAGLLGFALFYGARLISKIKWNVPKTEETSMATSVYHPLEVGDKYQHLILKGLDKSWVMVTMDDGQSSSQVDLDQGETKTYKALKTFKLKLGNAGGVEVQFNGKSLGVLGTTGQVVEIQLPPGSESGTAETKGDS